ncbi:kinesin light chain [Colletotrichum liriopes]|uniref:Kinesin light chain n=1 Tax=Colletotrichum liriopes TaxID=708192 RepID=A0AA37H174_9PEZI|nr:kinesin light chain [Colletotrichum liriopes]
MEEKDSGYESSTSSITALPEDDEWADYGEENPPIATPEKYRIRFAGRFASFWFPYVIIKMVEAIAGEDVAWLLAGSLRNLQPGFTRVYFKLFQTYDDLPTLLAETVFLRLSWGDLSTSPPAFVELHDASMMPRLREWRQRQRLVVRGLFDDVYETREEGRFEAAADLGRDLLAKCRMVYGNDSEETNGASYDLGLTYVNQGELQKAKTIFEEVVDKFRNEIHLTKAKAALAATCSKLGDLDEAMKIEKEVLERIQQTHDKDDLETITAMQNLSVTLERRGRLEEAFTLQSEVLELTVTNFGRDNLETAQIMTLLACTLGRFDMEDVAEELHRSVLKIRQQRLSDEHPSTIAALQNVATALLGQGLFEEAEKTLRKVIQMNAQVLGEKHCETIMAKHNLGVALLRSKKELDEAAELLSMAVQQHGECYGRNHFATLTTRVFFAQTLEAQGKTEKALESHMATWNDCRLALGDEHYYTLRITTDLIEMLERHGKLDETVAVKLEAGMPSVLPDEDSSRGKSPDLQKRVLDVLRRSLGDTHNATTAAMHRLAHTYFRQGNLAHAYTMSKEVVNNWKPQLGKEDFLKIKAIDFIGLALFVNDKLAEAAAIQEDLLHITQQIYGDQHPETMIANSRLATTRLQQGEWKDAATMFAQVLNSYECEFGQHDLRTITIRVNLSEALRSQGRNDEAKDLLKGLMEILPDLVDDDDVAGVAKYIENMLDGGIREVGQVTKHPSVMVFQSGIGYIEMREGMATVRQRLTGS